MNTLHRQFGGTWAGIFIGLVIGVLLSLGAVLVVTETPLPFQDRGINANAPTGEDRGSAVAPLPGKPGDKVGNKPDDKPRFEFYKILPGSQEATPAGGAKPATEAAKGSGELQYLQVGAFQQPADADNLKAKLALMGLDAGVQEADLPEKGKIFRVRTGPYSSVEEMNRARAVLSQHGIKATQVKGK